MSRPSARLSVFGLIPLAIAAASPALAQGRTNWNRGTPITVRVDNDRFSPAQIRMRAGRPYILTIRNVSDRKHNFSAKTFFGIARVAPQDSGWVTDNKVDLAPGQTARLRIIAPATPNAVYEFRSTNLLDATSNLKGEILVN